MERKKITIIDIAKHLNVNPSTVSRGLNPNTRHLIMPETVTRILKAAEKLGYYPNRAAYALKKNQTFTIGILIPNIQNPVFPPIIRGIEKILLQMDYTPIIANTDDDPDLEQKAITHLKSLNVDGLIIATATRSDPLIGELVQQKWPIVLINRTVDNLDVNQVLTDEADGVRKAFEHLVNSGHTRIAYVAGPQNVSTGFRRRRAFLACAADFEVTVDEDLIEVAAAYSEKEGYSSCMRLLSRRTDLTALMAGNDLLALGCLDALREHGIRCPKDISLIGYDDMPMLERMTPPLTTLAIPHYEMGCGSAQTILEILNKPEASCRSILLKPKLVIRKSTATVPQYPDSQ